MGVRQNRGYPEHVEWVCDEIRGTIEESSLAMGTYGDGSHQRNMNVEFRFKVEGTEYSIEDYGIPRLDVGEKVIMHLSNNCLVGIQILSGEEAVKFRFTLPFGDRVAWVD